jgi:hypothetical protein
VPAKGRSCRELPVLDRRKSHLSHRRQREPLALSLVALLAFCLAATLAAIILILVFGALEFTSAARSLNPR